jgi:hypothetical protein
MKRILEIEFGVSLRGRRVGVIWVSGQPKTRGEGYGTHLLNSSWVGADEADV